MLDCLGCPAASVVTCGCVQHSEWSAFFHESKGRGCSGLPIKDCSLLAKLSQLPSFHSGFLLYISGILCSLRCGPAELVSQSGFPGLASYSFPCFGRLLGQRRWLCLLVMHVSTGFAPVLVVVWCACLWRSWSSHPPFTYWHRCQAQQRCGCADAHASRGNVL